MNKLNGIILVLVLVLALWIVFCGAAAASQLYVNESGWWHDGDMFNASSAPIQSAVDGATDGDSISVRSGSYSGDVRIDKDLMIKGEDRGATIIDGGGRSGDCIRVSGADVGISGFTVKNAGGHGVYAYGSDLNLSNVTIGDCEDDAIHFKSGKMLTLRDSVLENSGGGLIYDKDYKSPATGNATIERNIIRNNTGDGLFIYLDGSTGKGEEAIINDNVMTNNTGYGVRCNYRNGPIDSITMRNNTVRNCTNDGVYIRGATDLSITDLTIENAGNNGLWVNYCEKMVVNPPFSIKEVSGYGIYASGPDFTLDNATIRSCGDDAIHFKSGKTLTLRDSVLENSGGGLIYDKDYKSPATGNATIERNIIRNNTGDGLYIKLVSGKSVVINDNIIINSTGSSSDGVCCDISSNGVVTIANNIVKNSGKDGMYLWGVVNVTIANTTVDTAKGYGLYAPGCNLSITDATIRGCGNDAIYFKSGKMLTLRDSVLENSGGGLIYDKDYKSPATGNATIERNIIRNNTGDGLYIKLVSGKSVVINDNIIINSTGSSSDGVCCDISSNGVVAIANNIVKNSGKDGMYLWGVVNVTISNTTVDTAKGYGLYAPTCDLMITDATIRGCGDDAIYFKSGKSLTLSDSILENCAGGLIYYYKYAQDRATGNATIERNIIRNNTGDGLYIKLASRKNAVINDNIIINSTGSDSDGIYCNILSNGLVTIANNIIKNSGKDGMYLSGVKNSTLLNNTVLSNKGRGISLYSAHSFLIFHNNFINNSPNAYDSDPASNDWYHPVLLEGNYWSDYTGDDDGSGTEKHDMAGDGIGDTDIPHPIEEYDQYPFVNDRGWLIQHDIAVTNIDAPVFVEVNLTIMINSTVWNFGLSNESNITVDFIMGGVSQSTTTIPFLKSGSYTNVCFQWTAPSVAGMHDILIYAEPVVDETIDWNNKLNKIVTVGDIWVPATYPTIQQAVNNAAAGDTIIVRDGTYTENVGVNKSLTILAENGSTSTIVQAANPDDAIFEVIVDYVNISGFTVTGADKAGFYLYGADCCNISNNNVSNNSKGIYLNFSSNCVLTNNNASSNNDIGSKDAVGYSYGIHLSFSSNCMLINNAANTNMGQGSRGSVVGDKPGGDGCGNGIILHSSSNCTLINNTAKVNIGRGGNGGRDSGVTDCGTDGGDGYGYGIVLSSSDNCTLMNNMANSNTGSGGNGGYSRKMVGGNGGNGSGCGIVLSSSSNCTLISNTANTNMGGGGSSGGGFISGYGGYGYDFGIYIGYSSNHNTLHHNNLIANTINAYDLHTNQWNSTTAGNYYSDYNGTDPDGDGIGNDPHPIPGGLNMDHYPLIAPCCGIWVHNDAVAAMDARVALQLAARGAQNPAADMNGDGRITALDALMALQAASGAMKS